MRLCHRRCLSVCLFVCLLATLRKNFSTDLHEIFREGWHWASEQMIKKFWWRSGSQIATLVRGALAEVCTVQMLLHRESKKGATLTMAITLSILSLLQRAVNFQQSQY